MHLYDFLVTGTHVGVVDWDPVYGGHIPNGNFCMHVPAPVSQYSGFQSATKMAKGRVPGKKAKVLKNKRIDSYHCP